MKTILIFLLLSTPCLADDLQDRVAKMELDIQESKLRQEQLRLYSTSLDSKLMELKSLVKDELSKLNYQPDVMAESLSEGR